MYTITFPTGLMVLSNTDTGNTIASYVLGNFDVYGPFDAEADFDVGRADIHIVSIRQGDSVRSIDIRDVDSPTYATTQDLIDDIDAAIAAL